MMILDESQCEWMMEGCFSHEVFKIFYHIFLHLGLIISVFSDISDEGADQLVTGMMAARQICLELSYNSPSAIVATLTRAFPYNMYNSREG
jgi:hypothetical protein